MISREQFGPVSRASFGPIARAAMDTNTLDAARLIHNVALGHDEVGSVNDALGWDSVKPGAVMRAHRQIKEHAQRTLEVGGFPERFKVFRKGSLDGGVVAVSSRPVEIFHPQKEYSVNRADVLTHGEGFNPWSAYAEDEMHVHGSKLQPWQD